MTGKVRETDVLIVGSGPVGAAFARRLRDLCPATITIVEAGPALTRRAGENVRNLPFPEREAAYRLARRFAAQRPSGTAVADAPILVARPGTQLLDPEPRLRADDAGMPAAAMSSNVGGMGAHWTCACPRPGGSECIDFIAPARLEAAFDEAERLLGVTRRGFEASASGRFVAETLAGLFDAGRAPGREVQPMPLACRPQGLRLPKWAGADVVLGGLADPEERARSGVRLHANTLCRRLVVEGARVAGAELLDLDTGSAWTIDARLVVVAADALRTPQLLYASGLSSPALGRYLNDQPQIVSLIELHFASAGGAVSERSDDRRDRVTGVTWIPFEDRHFPFHGQVMQLEASPIDLGAGAASAGGPVVGMGLFLAKDIRPEDRIVFLNERDALGMPAMRIDYGLTEKDRAAAESARQAIEKAARHLGAFVPGGEPRLLPAGSSLHYQGSHRMGPENDGSSVCDPTSRVWGIANLYLGGNGVIPTSTACNPTLTSVALATIAAEAIAEDLAGVAGGRAPADEAAASG